MGYVRTQGVVLRTIEYSETSQIVAFITPDSGQLHGLAKGARRPRKDARSPLDLFMYCDIILAKRGPGHLHILADWSVRETFSGLRLNLCRLWPAFYAAEVTLACTSENPDDGAACDQLVQFLRRVSRGEDVNLALFLFLTLLLRTIGSVPIVDRCAHCGGELQGRTRFSARTGGVLCESCVLIDPSAFAIQRGPLAVMSYLAVRTEINPALRLSLPQIEQIRRAFNEQIQYHLDRPLRSARFLAGAFSSESKSYKDRV